jgi:hypothetical protein
MIPPGGAAMDLPALYDEDVYAWALHQAEALRRLKASGLPLPNDLDLDNVVEEIESLGNEQLFQVESNLRQAMIHLVKLARSPDDEATAHWTSETIAFIENALDRYRPSMRRALDVQALWAKARRRLRRDTADDVGAVPEACPFTLDELLDEDADPRALAARLAALLPRP